MPAKPKFSARKQQRILAYIEQYNSEHNGRGGVNAAAKKYKVTPATLIRWKKNAGADTPVETTAQSAAKKSAAKKSTAKKSTAKKSAKRGRRSATAAKTLVSKITRSLKRIDKLQQRIADLQQQLATEKDSLTHMIG
jgi:hypothetical protein